MTRVRVIGCGNLEAGDDAAGLLAVREAAGRLPAEVEVVEAGPLQVLDLLDDADAVIVVDAVRTSDARRAPGAIVRAEAGPDGLPSTLRSSLSSHGIGLAEAVGLAASLGPLPRITLIGIEVGEVAAGAPPSPPVREALPALVDAVVAAALEHGEGVS